MNLKKNLKSKVEIDDKSAISQAGKPMKSVIFNDWYYANRSELKDTPFKDVLNVTWKSALDLNVDTTKADILKLKQNIEDTKEIECTCDKTMIAQGHPCQCIRSGAIQQAILNLTEYIKELK